MSEMKLKTTCLQVNDPDIPPIDYMGSPIEPNAICAYNYSGHVVMGEIIKKAEIHIRPLHKPEHIFNQTKTEL